jgi:Spy/CpxP family protein refolding chaperone
MKIATVSLAMLLSVAVVFAQQGPFGEGPRMGAGQTDQVKSFLNLSDQQLQDLKNLQTSFRDAAHPLMQQIREKAQTLRQTLQQDSNADVAQLKADLASLQGQVKDLRTQYRNQALAVLTEQQKTSLATLQKALEMMPTARQAMGLNLLEGPEGFPGGFGGPEFLRGRGPGAPPKQ